MNSVLFFRTVIHVEITASQRNGKGTATLKGLSRVKNAKSTIYIILIENLKKDLSIIQLFSEINSGLNPKTNLFKIYTTRQFLLT